jgi:hypothetical protein
MKRSEIMAFLTRATRAGIAAEGLKRARLEAAGGGAISPSGIFQGRDKEGFDWSGHYLSLSHVRKVALPGDCIDFYVYAPGMDGDLITNLMVVVPDPARGIIGGFKSVGGPFHSIV